MNSVNFSTHVQGLRLVWNLSVRCWSCDRGVKLTNPIVMCLNLLHVTTDHDDDDRRAQVCLQFGVYSHSLGHYTMGQLDTATVQLRSSSKLTSVGYQNIYIADNNLDDREGVRLAVRFNIRLPAGGEEPSQGLESMIDDEQSSDMSLCCQDKIFRVHKCILSSRSPIISQLILSSKHSSTEDTEDETDDVRKTSVMSDAYIVSDDEEKEEERKVVEDVDSGVESNFSSGAKIDQLVKNNDNIDLDYNQDVVMKFLEFVYAGKFGMMDLKTLESLLSLADLFQVKELKLLCEGSLRESLQASNVASLLYLGHLHDSDNLKRSALKFCKDNHQNIIKVLMKKNNKVNIFKRHFLKLCCLGFAMEED